MIKLFDGISIQCTLSSLHIHTKLVTPPKINKIH
jgi:hypothetical protein